MGGEIYEKLREQLDQYSTGFPKTESGIELKILNKLFNEEEASLFLDSSLMLEEPESVAERTGRDPQEVAQMLENMAQKGLIFRLRKGDETRYAASAFIIGSYEYQLKRMDREMAEMFEAYFEEAMFPNIANNIVPLRTVPVNRSIDVAHTVASYEDARQIIRAKDKIALADCVCRKQQALMEKVCDKPMEVCLLFGSHADFYVENKMARHITREEAIAILDKCEEAGLVNQPANMINPGGMCNCCGDCCNSLRAIKHSPKPSELVFNNYFARVDQEECTACETCIERCQMEAVAIEDEQGAVVDTDRCIGCGLCVTTCPSGAIQLEMKPEDQRRIPPANARELMNMTAEKRGKSLIPLFMSRESG